MLIENTLENPGSIRAMHVVACLAVLGLALIYGPVLLTCEQTMLLSVAGAGREPQGMILALLGICSAAGLAVIVVLLYSIASFRPEAPTTGFRLKPVKELLWALAPVAIVVGFALPAIQPLVAKGHASTMVAESGYRCTA